MITLIILGVIQLRKDNMTIKPRNSGDMGPTPIPGILRHTQQYCF